MILPYVIKSALTLALLYTCIMPLFEKETFHRLNRIIVLGCLLLSFIIPLIHFTDGTNQTIDMVRQAVQLPEIQIDGNANKQSVWSLTDILICIYTLGGVAMLSLTAIQTMSLMLRLRRCEHITDNKGNVIVLTDYATSPFCLFHYIDLIILQFATIIQWFNPFVWLIGKNLKAIHEFEVDEAVLNKGIDATQYQKFLVVKAVGNRLQPFANNLNKESLKRRIIMMNQKRSNRWMMLKALLVIPVATLAVSVFANGTNASETPKEPHPQKTTQTKIHDAVEEMPEFNGGQLAMMEFLMNNMKYPQAAVKAKQQGKAIVGFVVRKDGNVSDVHITKSAGHAVLDEEAIRVVKAMPAWKPGKQKGEPVNVKYSVPITFKLK